MSIESKKNEVKNLLKSNGVSGDTITTLFDMDWQWWDCEADELVFDMLDEIERAESMIARFI